MIDARTSFWNAPTVPSSANEKGVNTLNQLSAKVEFTFELCHRQRPFRDHRQYVPLEADLLAVAEALLAEGDAH